jgi:hypothetical protein
MAWNGAGSFSRTNGTHTGTTVWQQDAAADVDIEADRHDTHDQDLAAGINAALAKNGENAMTGDLNMGSQDITNAGSATFSGTVDASAFTISGTPIDEVIGAGLSTGNVTLYDSPQDAIDANRAVYFPADDYVNAELEVTESLRISGEGKGSTLVEGVIVPTTATGTIDLEISNISGTSTSSFVRAPATGAANLHFDIDGLHVDDAAGVINIENAGAISGSITRVHAFDNELGIRIGRNDRAESLGWGPVTISANVISGVVETADNPAYGIITYAPHSAIVGNYIAGVENDTGDDTEAVYLKSRHSTVVGNIVVNGGSGEGSLNIKGEKRGETSDPSGWGVVAVGNVFYADSTYTGAAPAVVSGTRIANDDVILAGSLYDGFTGAAINTLGAALDNITIRDVLIVNGTYTAGALYISASGKQHTVRGVTIANVDGNAIRLQGQNAATEITISDVIVEDAGGFGVLLRPSDDGVAQYRISDAVFRNIGGAAVIKFEAYDALSVSLTNVDVGNHAKPLGYASGIEPYSWNVRNLHKTIATTDATVTTAFQVRIPTGKTCVITMRVIGTDGTDSIYRELKSVYHNAAGTVSLIGSAVTVASVLSAGATSGSWTSVMTISSADVLITVTGEAAHNVSWKVSIDVDTP